MSLTISPFDLTLDKQNPRFVVLDEANEEAIRKYMAMYEDVCQLAEGINNNKGLLLGERIVIIQENNQNIVMEGNRRTVALQFLLDKSLIPDGFQHKIPTVTQETLSNITNIEVDIAPTRQYAIALMSKRHIEGVKEWKPLAKKQFFATMFMNGNPITELSKRTGIRASDIRKDIRDYKLLLSVSKKYKQDHPDFDEDLITYKIDPFLRILIAGQLVKPGLNKSPSEILKIKYDIQENTLSDLPGDMFEKILEMIFKTTIVDKMITTRNTLFDILSIKALLDTLEDNQGTTEQPSSEEENEGSSTGSDPSSGGGPTDGSSTGSDPSSGGGPTDGSSTGSDPSSGGSPTDGSSTGSDPSSGGSPTDGSSTGSDPSSGGSPTDGSSTGSDPSSGGGPTDGSSTGSDPSSGGGPTDGSSTGSDPSSGGGPTDGSSTGSDPSSGGGPTPGGGTPGNFLRIYFVGW